MNKNNIKQDQRGITHIFLLIALVLVVGGVSYFAYDRIANKSKQNPNSAPQTSNKSSQSDSSGSDTPTIKNLPIELGKYDPTTGMAGDLKFAKWKMEPGGLDAIFLEYGRKIVNSISPGEGRLNPQPTFIAPLGTKVRSIVDGTVYDVPKLYSNDYSIMVQGKDQSIIFETEHIINPQVKKGDIVKAGQVIAEVSDYDSHNLNGLGLVEMGVLLPGNPPQHACTFDYLDPAVKDDISKKLTQLMDDWESFVGDKNIFDQANQPIVGCATNAKVEG